MRLSPVEVPCERERTSCLGEPPAASRDEPRNNAAHAGLTFEFTRPAEAGGVSPACDDATAGTRRAYNACRSGSGVQRGVRPHCTGLDSEEESHYWSTKRKRDFVDRKYSSSTCLTRSLSCGDASVPSVNRLMLLAITKNSRPLSVSGFATTMFMRRLSGER